MITPTDENQKPEKKQYHHHCHDCGWFKSKAEHQADLHAGGGW